MRRLVDEAQFFARTCLQKNLFKTIYDKQITVFIAITRSSNFSIIIFLISGVHLKPNQFLKFRKSITVADYLTLNVDIFEVFVLAKASWPIL